MLRPSHNYRDLIARAGLAPKDVIARAGIARATYFGWLNPTTQPNRAGGIRLENAWKIAKVYAQTACVSEESAFAALFIEVIAEPLASADTVSSSVNEV